MRVAGRLADQAQRRRVLQRAVSGLALGAFLLLPDAGRCENPLFLGVTTSTENSGLLAHLTEAFQADHDIQIRAVTAGSGAVLNLAARGDVDVILVHSPEDEDAFLQDGYGVDRRPVMQNRYVIVGPKSDPVGIQGVSDAATALAMIAASRALFLSRGDESGTHKAERRLWQAAGVDPSVFEHLDQGRAWYRESGSGQGATLNIAANTSAYTLTDEATWATFGNPGGLQELLARDEPLLRNIYSVIRVNPERHSGLNAEGALIFADWLTSEAGQAAISSFKAGGRSLFRPAGRLAG